SCDYRDDRVTPRPPPIPYTTLFRSGRGEVGVRFLRDRHSLVEGRDVLGQSGGGLDDHRAEELRALQTSQYYGLLHLFRALHEPGDRKSTRLNSSHVKISYAVFCLKK